MTLVKRTSSSTTLQMMAYQEYPPSPTYSIEPGHAEHVIQPQPPSDSNRHLGWIFETDHMQVNLGPRIWNLHQPSYGLSGKVQGCVKFKGVQSKVTQVTVTVSS
jgi:hypothetical protein